MAKEYKDLVVGLDIGTSKIMAVVGEVMPGGELRLAGLGMAPSHGLKRGVVVNIDATVQAIQQALKEAEMMADCKITRVFTGITGSHIRGQNSTGMVIVRDKEVTPVDVARVVETAKAINIPNDQRLLLVEPQEFVIDGHEVKEPIGMSGGRLEVKRAYRDRRSIGGRKHRQVCASLRSGSRATGAQSIGFRVWLR
jgi:cell division protein FtsA